MSSVLKYKFPELRREFEGLPEKLREMALCFNALSAEFGIEAVVTRVLEAVPGSSGVHEVGRAVDFRDAHENAFTYNEDQRLALLYYIRAKFPRGDTKKSIIWHSFNGGPHHFHLQIPKEWL